MKVAEIRERLLNIADRVMHARYLVGLLDYESVSVDDVYDDLRAAHTTIDEIWSVLHEEDGKFELLALLALGVVGFVVLAGLGWN